MRHLTKKAYQTTTDDKQDYWKRGGNIIKIFSSKSYKFNPQDNILQKV